MVWVSAFWLVTGEDGMALDEDGASEVASEEQEQPTSEEGMGEDAIKGVPNVVFADEVLLKRIVEKHRRFITELQQDIENTMERIERLEESIRQHKREIERERTLISVLNEKPKQLCHQISLIRGQLMEEVQKHAPELTEELRQPLSELEGFESHIETHVIEPKEGLELSNAIIPTYERVRDALASHELLREHVHRAFDTISSKLLEVVDSYNQLLSMADSRSEGFAHLDDELEKARGHLSWASNRLKSHEGALIYWQQEARKEGVEV